MLFLHAKILHISITTTEIRDKNSLSFKNTNPTTLPPLFFLGNLFSLALLYRGHQFEITQDAQDIPLKYS